jgi:uncharacterized membrane protein YeaQ/YmgE (transglycosylase-associated protein family)
MIGAANMPLEPTDGGVAMGVISWVIFGALAGWVASIVMGTNARQGCLMNIVVGVIGAFLGGLIVQVLTHQPVWFNWSLRSFGIAVLGAVVLLAITGWGQRRAR